MPLTVFSIKFRINVMIRRGITNADQSMPPIRTPIISPSINLRMGSCMASKIDLIKANGKKINAKRVFKVIISFFIRRNIRRENVNLGSKINQQFCVRSLPWQH